MPAEVEADGAAAAWARDGYYVLRGVLGAATIDALRAASESCLQQWRESSTPDGEHPTRASRDVHPGHLVHPGHPGHPGHLEGASRASTRVVHPGHLVVPTTCRASSTQCSRNSCTQPMSWSRLKVGVS